MADTLTDIKPAGRTKADGCPQCSGVLLRVRRRPIDRLASTVSPVYRYRCENFHCHWEGNLQVPRKDFVATGRAAPLEAHAQGESESSSLPLSFVLTTSLAFAAFLVMVLMAFMDLPEDAADWAGSLAADTPAAAATTVVADESPTAGMAGTAAKAAAQRGAQAARK